MAKEFIWLVINEPTYLLKIIIFMKCYLTAKSVASSGHHFNY